MATPTPHRHPFRTYVLVVGILMLAVSIPGFVRAQAPPPEITITDLGRGWAFAINNQGQVVGFSPAEGGIHASLWEDGAMVDLGTLGGNQGAAYGINDHGLIVGMSDFEPSGYGPHAFLCQNGTMVDLGMLPGTRYCCSEAFDINNNGQIVGASGTATNQWHASLWQNGTVTDLDTLGGHYNYATAINDHGQVVGFPGFLWQNGTMTNLAMEGGFWDINNQGQIVGMSNGRATLWQNGIMTDLGTLGGDVSFAFAINEQGQVVGGSRTASGAIHAFLWQDGSMIDLGTLGAVSSTAYGINDHGLIVGMSETPDGAEHAVLWQVAFTPPTPEEQIEALRSQVAQLLDINVLNQGQANALTTKLDGALAKLERGDDKAAANQLHAFVNQVEAFHKAKKLTTVQAQPLIDAANGVIEQLRR